MKYKILMSYTMCSLLTVYLIVSSFENNQATTEEYLTV